jgi:hypothetical protein
MTENQTVPDPLSQDIRTPITTGGTIPEDPWLADDQIAPIEPAAQQSTLVLTDAEPRRSLHDRVRRLGHKHADALSQTQPQGSPRARITARAITTISLCLTTALITSVITSRSQHAASTGQPRQPASHRCTSTRQGKPRHDHPQHSQAALATTRAQPLDNQPPSVESQPQPAPQITSERPEVAVPPPSTASEVRSTPAASPSEPQVPNHDETHTQTVGGSGGGPFSP